MKLLFKPLVVDSKERCQIVILKLLRKMRNFFSFHSFNWCNLNWQVYLMNFYLLRLLNLHCIHLNWKSRWWLLSKAALNNLSHRECSWTGSKSIERSTYDFCLVILWDYSILFEWLFVFHSWAIHSSSSEHRCPIIGVFINYVQGHLYPHHLSYIFAFNGLDRMDNYVCR